MQQIRWFLPVGFVYCAPAQTALSHNSRRAQYTNPPQAGIAFAKNTVGVFFILLIVVVRERRGCLFWQITRPEFAIG